MATFSAQLICDQILEKMYSAVLGAMVSHGHQLELVTSVHVTSFRVLTDDVCFSYRVRKANCDHLPHGLLLHVLRVSASHDLISCGPVNSAPGRLFTSLLWLTFTEPSLLDAVSPLPFQQR